MELFSSLLSFSFSSLVSFRLTTSPGLSLPLLPFIPLLSYPSSSTVLYLLLFFPLSLFVHLLPSPALPPSLPCFSLHTSRSKVNGRCQAPNSPPARDRTWVGLLRKN
ncbi:hypothetical protein BDQ17DRAFT_1378047 [Cyathus striatus]|nr:hypothetical protein BDQ17DRAFT_1378047 [Cyathus striatus]